MRHSASRLEKRHAGDGRRFVGSPTSAELLTSYLGSESECWDSVLSSLEGEQSLLTDMLRSFIAEAQLDMAGQHCSSSTGLSSAAASSARTQHTHQAAACPSHSPKQVDLDQQQASIKRPRETELPLSVTLEELFSGAVKRVPLQLRRHDALTGATMTVAQQLQVCVQPGLHEGTRITLPGLGNQDKSGHQSDLTFIVRQQLHPAFRRQADDLYATVNVPLVTALTGGPVSLKTLSGQLLQLPLDEDAIITPSTELVVQNQGMPVFGDASGRRGALHVRFHVRFPSHLSQQQQQLLRQALAGAGSQQQHLQQSPRAVAAAVAVAAGLQPGPSAGLRLLPSSAVSSSAPQPWDRQHQHQKQQQLRQRQQDQQNNQADHKGNSNPYAGLLWPPKRAHGGGKHEHASAAVAAAAAGAVRLGSSPDGSNSSSWCAAGVGSTGAVSITSSSSVTGRTVFNKVFAAGAVHGSMSAAAAHGASSSSAAGFSVCMQSTGSSRPNAWSSSTQT